MEHVTETVEEYTLLSSAQLAGPEEDQYTAMCVIKKGGKIIERVSTTDLSRSASEANEKVRRLALRRLGDWQRSA